MNYSESQAHVPPVTKVSNRNGKNKGTKPQRLCKMVLKWSRVYFSDEALKLGPLKQGSFLT